MGTTDKKKTSKTTASTSAATSNAGSTTPNLAKLIADAQASNTGGTTAQGPTMADAEGYVQNIYQQMLGRNAAGAQLSKAINVFMNQAKGTDATGRQQAVVDLIQADPEYKVKQENRYLDAIYKKVASDVGRAQA